MVYIQKADVTADELMLSSEKPRGCVWCRQARELAFRWSRSMKRLAARSLTVALVSSSSLKVNISSLKPMFDTLAVCIFESST